MNNVILSLSNYQFEILASGHKTVGNKKKYPNVDFEWTSNPNRKFSHWASNRLWYVVKGFAFVKTTFGEFNLTEGHSYFIPQDSIISTECDEFMEQYFVDFLIDSALMPMEAVFTFNHELTEKEIILPLMIELEKSAKEKSEVANIKNNSLINAIISRFIEKPIFNQNKNSTIIINTLEIINKELTSNITINYLSKEVGYNCEYLSRIFKKHLGVSPQMYIINKRMDLAKHMLITTNDSIKNIALQCGYNNPLYFTKIFTKCVGASPSYFREYSKNITNPTF